MARRFPGVITPVPLVKTPVRLVVPPAATAGGFAVKLLMVGSDGDQDVLTQPVRPARHRLREDAQRA
jgi:predicted acyl esterase